MSGALRAMSGSLRHLLAVAALPFTVTVLGPLWIARRAGVGLVPGAHPVARALALQLAGGACLAIEQENAFRRAVSVAPQGCRRVLRVLLYGRAGCASPRAWSGRSESRGSFG
jgi:hypothetical protein